MSDNQTPPAPAAIVNPVDLDAIKARLSAATPGPWAVGNSTDIVRGLQVTGRGSYTCIQSVAEVDEDREDWGHDGYVEVDPEDDAQFIAHARQDVEDLVAEVTRLRQLLDGPCGSCHPCTNYRPDPPTA